MRTATGVRFFDQIAAEERETDQAALEWALSGPSIRELTSVAPPVDDGSVPDHDPGEDRCKEDLRAPLYSVDDYAGWVDQR